MNILIIHEIDWLKKVVFEIHTLSESLSALGHNVYAIDYESMWQKRHKLDFGTLKTKELKTQRSDSGKPITLIRPGFVKIPAISRALAWFTHYHAIERTIKERKIDVIILYSVPTNGLQTIRLAKKYKIPVIFRSIDILNQLVSVPALSFVTCLMELQVYRNVDLVLSISPRLSDYVASFGVPEDKIKLLPLSVNMKRFYPTTPSDIGKQWGIQPDDNVILFIGTLPDFSGLPNFISRFPTILKDVPDAKILIVGDGIQRQKLHSIIDELQLSGKVIITGFQPFDSMPQYINLAQVCISTFPVIDATRDIFPTKIVQYLACGKPVLSMKLHGLKAMIDGENQGIVYCDDYDDMANQVIRLLKSEDDRKRIGNAANEYANKIHSEEAIVKQLVSELNALVLSATCNNRLDNLIIQRS